MRYPDTRTARAQAYRKWYSTTRWRKLRTSVLRDQPLCQMCSTPNIPVPATVCDHVTPHRGDEHLFWSGPFQGLCAPCHDQHKQGIEARGYGTAIDADGWPLDTSHPVNVNGGRGVSNR